MTQNKKITGLFLRYLTVIILGTGNLYLIYKILTPLTIHTTNILLNIFTQTTLRENVIYFSQATIQIVPACVAGSAFYLLIALLFTTADIKPKTRAYAILTAISIFFILNITRILILIPLITFPNFETIHWIFWHIVSTVFVVATYIATTKLYKIKSIPVYSDFKYLISLTKKPKLKLKR
jgi:exosortase/archaeosortase family protein